MISKVHDMVNVSIADAEHTSHERVLIILHKYFSMKRLSANQVPRSLTYDQMRMRIKILKTLAKLKGNPTNFNEQ